MAFQLHCNNPELVQMDKCIHMHTRFRYTHRDTHTHTHSRTRIPVMLNWVALSSCRRWSSSLSPPPSTEEEKAGGGGSGVRGERGLHTVLRDGEMERDRIEGEGRKTEGEERGMSEWGRREG